MWNFERYKDKIAVITDEGEKITYGTFDDLQNEFNEYIVERSLVCILAENTFESLLGYVSCILNNNVPIMLPVERGQLGLLQIINVYQPDYIWISKEIWRQEGKEKYKEEFLFRNNVLVRLSGQRMDKALHKDLALLLYTSGSTGYPKLVRLSKQNIVYNTKAICQYLKLKDYDCVITSLPIGYTYGLSLVNMTFFSGASILLTRASVLQKRFWDLMYGNEVTVLAGVPYTYECLKRIQMDKFVLPKLRILTQAGGRMEEEQQYFWAKYAGDSKRQFYIMYGQTEATARISYLPFEDCLRKIGSVGIPILGSKIQIMNSEDGNFKGEGEIVCIGDHISMGYAEIRDDLGLPDMNKGVLYTGDLGYLDEEGYLYITGRKNRFAKIYGRRINLIQVERIAQKLFDKDVVAISDDKKIFLYTDGKVGKELIEKLMKNISFSVNPFVVKNIEQLPRKENGKIKYYL